MSETHSSRESKHRTWFCSVSDKSLHRADRLELTDSSWQTLFSFRESRQWTCFGLVSFREIPFLNTEERTRSKNHDAREWCLCTWAQLQSKGVLARFQPCTWAAAHWSPCTVPLSLMREKPHQWLLEITIMLPFESGMRSRYQIRCIDVNGAL